MQQVDRSQTSVQQTLCPSACLGSIHYSRHKMDNPTDPWKHFHILSLALGFCYFFGSTQFSDSNFYCSKFKVTNYLALLILQLDWTQLVILS